MISASDLLWILPLTFLAGAMISWVVRSRLAESEIFYRGKRAYEQGRDMERSFFALFDMHRLPVEGEAWREGMLKTPSLKGMMELAVKETEEAKANDK